MHERLLVFLLGTKSTNSHLCMLDGHVDLVSKIWYHVLTPIERCIGTKSQCSWQQEWMRAVVESMYGCDCIDRIPPLLVSRLFEPSAGICCFEKMTDKLQSRMVSKALRYALRVNTAEHGSVISDDYKAYFAYETVIRDAIQKSLIERSTRYATIVHHIYNCMLNIAESSEAHIRNVVWGYTPLYCTMTGKSGLSTKDNTWSALLCDTVAIGQEFVTRVDADFIKPFKSNFANSEGMYRWCVYGNRIENRLIESDVVCLKNYPPKDNTHHSAIQTEPPWSFKLPPFTTITLVDIKKPGEWNPYPYELNINRRLFVVRAAFARVN